MHAIAIQSLDIRADGMEMPNFRPAIVMLLSLLLPCVGTGSVTATVRDKIAISASLNDSNLVPAPRMFQNFCLNRPDQCVTHGRSDFSKLNSAGLALLTSVNQRVNFRIHPLSEPTTDSYQLGVTMGSCNEFAVEKRRELLEQGWATATLSLAVVRLPDGRGHLVLTVRTDRGDLVLDNLSNRVRGVEQTNYTWIQRQSTIHPMLWVRIAGLSTEKASASTPTRLVLKSTDQTTSVAVSNLDDR